MKRILFSLSDEVVEKMDEQVQKLGLPSRNAYAEQIFRREFGLPNIMEAEP